MIRQDETLKPGDLIGYTCEDGEIETGFIIEIPIDGLETHAKVMWNCKDCSISFEENVISDFWRAEERYFLIAKSDT